MSASDDSAILPGDKKLPTPAEINRENHAFWKAQSRKFKKQVEKHPDLVEKAFHKMEADALEKGIKSVRSMEHELGKKIEQKAMDDLFSRLRVKLTPREQKIWKVIQLGSEGEQYCRELHNAKVKPCRAWVDDGCPANYVEAYREGPPIKGRISWRKRIQDEKHRIRNKARRAQLVV